MEIIYISNNKRFIEPTSGFLFTLLPCPALRAGLFKLNHIRGEPRSGFNLKTIFQRLIRIYHSKLSFSV